MRGEILGFDKATGTGVLRAEDGRRYRFAMQDWRESAAPEKAAGVDFEPHGENATEIYLVRRRAPSRSLPQRARAFGRWFRQHPEASLALALMAATALPVYGFLGVEEPLLAAPRVVERLELGLGRIRMLVADIPEANTAAAAIRAMLPVVYLLWAVPILALLLLYRSMAEIPRRGLAFWTGISAVLLPALIPLSIALPTTVLVLARMPEEMRATVAGSVFDIASLGPFRDIAFGGMVFMLLGFGLVIWGIRPEPEPSLRPAPARGQGAQKRKRAAGSEPALRGRRAPASAASAQPQAGAAAPPPQAVTTLPPKPPAPPRVAIPPVAGPRHPPPPAAVHPAGRAAKKTGVPAPVQAFAPPARKPSAPAIPALPAGDDAYDPLPSVLTRGRIATSPGQPQIDARKGQGMPATATATGWEVEAHGTMSADLPRQSPPQADPPPPPAGLRGTYDDADGPVGMPAGTPLPHEEAGSSPPGQPQRSRPDWALDIAADGMPAAPPAARPPEPPVGTPAPDPEPLPPPEPPRPTPPPRPQFELDQGPDAVVKLYEKLRAERLAKDAARDAAKADAARGGNPAPKGRR
ncbi:MAG: hypothetical protein H6880_02515 [Rhodobiaceae bacterium]|nr:hypothetical protein [Rhodobiaceae bacterium]